MPLLLKNELEGDGADDMTSLAYLHEAALLHNLEHRLTRHLVYTNVGQICIAVRHPHPHFAHVTVLARDALD